MRFADPAGERQKSMLAMSLVTQHMVKRDDGAAVELFQCNPPGGKNHGAILLVHGNQGGLRIGAKEAVDSGALLRFSSGLNIVAAAVSQPGFGMSDGLPDFCGPATQESIIAALRFLREQPEVDPTRIVLYGNSRGAVASAMVAAQISGLRAVILSSGVYDLGAALKGTTLGIRHAIEKEAGSSEEALRSRSALHHVLKMRSEVLLLHGRYDDRAPFSQAEEFSEALSAADVPNTLRVFECGHRIPREDVRQALRPLLLEIFRPSANVH